MESSHRSHHLQLGSSASPALGFIEVSSISRGLFLTDVVLKKAPVRIIASQPVSSGKHVLLFTGEVAAVEESHQAALKEGDGTVLRHVLIPAVHEELSPFLDSIWSAAARTSPAQEAVGMVESSSVAGAVLAADRALKTAAVALCRMRLGQGIGGKAYFVITGRQDDLEAALDAARTSLEQADSYLRCDLLPRPLEETLTYF